MDEQFGVDCVVRTVQLAARFAEELGDQQFARELREKCKTYRAHKTLERHLKEARTYDIPIGAKVRWCNMETTVVSVHPDSGRVRLEMPKGTYRKYRLVGIRQVAEILAK